MKLAMVLCLVLAACKTDGAEQPASSASGGTVAAPTDNGAKPRSGKIDPPPRLPHAGDVTDPDQDRGFDPSNMTDEERLERRKIREERREERRKERMEQLDANKDGQISPEEMQAGRKARVEEMRHRFDANNDGKLTVQELSDGRMGRRLDVDTVDANKDGDVSTEELQQSMDKMRERFRGMRGPRGSGDGSGGPDEP